MMPPPDVDLQFFNPNEDIESRSGSLPHWMQRGVVCFLTWRTHDSIPASWVDVWSAERAAWLRRHGIDPNDITWQERLAKLPYALRTEFQREFSTRFEAELDKCHGECVLRRPDPSELVARSLSHFDGERYTLYDFVVIPNHVHLLVTFHTLGEMMDQCTSWKRFTSNGINRLLGRSGRF